MGKFVKNASILLFYILVFSLFLAGTLLGNQAVNTIAEKLPVERKHTVVIDAGHGGEDGGAISCSGKPESNFNLQIALRADDLFHLLGYRTVMTRKTDSAIYTSGATLSQKKASDLKQRVRIADRDKNSVLVSIHQNTFPESQYYGAQVFYAKTAGSAELASAVQNALVNALDPESRRKEKASSGVYLLDKIHVPGILVECGFLSNPQEEQLLGSPDHQKKLACVICTAVSNFLAST